MFLEVIANLLQSLDEDILYKLEVQTAKTVLFLV